MKKRTIDLKEYAGHIFNAIPKGVMITVKNEVKVNSMVISWGTIGFEWGTPLFTTFVRTGRFTHDILADTKEFTVNIPLEGTIPADIFRICGSQSGRDIDKVKEAGLTLVEPEVISVPGIKEVPLTLECRVVYHQLQDRNAIAEKFMDNYPQDVDSTAPFGNKDFHEAFYGEIVAAYIIEE